MDERGEAFRVLYDEHRDGLYAYLLSRAGDREAALDLLQEVFLRAWRRLPELVQQGYDARRYWLYAVARNLTIDLYRSRPNRTWAPLPAVEKISVSGPALDEAVVAASELATLARAVCELPASLREPLVMSTVGSLSSAAIGKVLGIPAGTVRYRVSLARARLAHNLGRGTVVRSQC